MGGFNMARNYTHIKAVEKEIYEMREAGKTRQEIAVELGLTKVQIKNLINRRNRTERKTEAGIPPKRRGRPRKDSQIIGKTEKEKDNEINQLKMENRLLRDFLHLVGRGRSHQ